MALFNNFSVQQSKNLNFFLVFVKGIAGLK